MCFCYAVVVWRQVHAFGRLVRCAPRGLYSTLVHRVRTHIHHAPISYSVHRTPFTQSHKQKHVVHYWKRKNNNKKLPPSLRSRRRYYPLIFDASNRLRFFLVFIAFSLPVGRVPVFLADRTKMHHAPIGLTLIREWCNKNSHTHAQTHTHHKRRAHRQKETNWKWANERRMRARTNVEITKRWQNSKSFKLNIKFNE